MRRSIDDYPFTADDLPAGADDAGRLSWAVAISDDYDDAEPRVVSGRCIGVDVRSHRT